MKWPIGRGSAERSDLSRRAKLWLGGISAAVAVAVGVFAAVNLRSGPPSDCDTVRDLLDYNRQFSEQTKTSARTNNPELSTAGQYRDWAAGLKDYASRIHESGLSDRAQTAADLAGHIADLVPKYRADPDDVEFSRRYARTGIEFGNAITGLDYACPGAGS